MNIAWSPHAIFLQNEILQQIREALSSEDASRWYDRICDAVDPLSEFPYLGSEIPVQCFNSVPKNADRLRQIICKPYRIVYEPVEDEVHILSIRHARMLVTEGDTVWN